MSKAFVESLNLAPLDAPDVKIERTRSVGGQPSAAIDAGGIVAFAGGISSQDREDILYSMQLAQRAASASADRYTQVDLWYRKYVEVLEATGWVLNGFNLNSQEVGETQVEVAKAALGIMAAAIGGPMSAVLLAAIDALKGMAKDDGFITLFEHYGAKGLVGNFQLSDVKKDGQKLSMTAGAFQVKMTERQEKFLFFKWHSKAISIWGDAVEATFNPKHYEPLRQTIRDKLGADAQSVIADLPIGDV